MKKPQNPLAHALATILGALAILLFTTGLSDRSSPTPTSTPSPRRAKCEDWFKDLKDVQKKDLKQAFVNALNMSAHPVAEEPNLRDDLLNMANNHETPKRRIQKIVDNYIKKQQEIDPAGKHEPVHFPNDSIFIFFEPAKAPSGPTPTPCPEKKTDTWYPNDHCLHVFYLPEVGGPQLFANDFQTNLQCCYEPW